MPHRHHAGPLRLLYATVVAAATVVMCAAVYSGSAGAHALPEEALGRTQSEALTALGLPQSLATTLPDAVGYAVTDVDAARSELAAATGTEFTPVTSTTAVVAFPATKTARTLTLQETRSVRGGPAIELVQADAAVGPWAAGQYAIPYISYSVDDIKASGRRLAAAGMRLVAVARDFAYWEGVEGFLVRLVEGPPPASGVNLPQAPIDLGAPPALVYSPCDRDALAAQVSAATGFEWRPQFSFTAPWEFDDGTVSTLTAVNDISVPGPPFVTIETPHHATAQYGCATHRHLHPVFLADDVAAAEAQLLAAGMPSIARVPGVVAYHLTDSGIFVEIAHSSFLSVIG